MKKKLLIIASILVSLIVVVCLFVFIQSNKWKQDISISGGEWVANGYLNDSANGGSMLDVAEKGNPYYDYQITNETNHPMSDVVIVFECESHGLENKKWKYNYDVGYLKPGEIKDIKVYYWEMFTDDEFRWSTNSTIKKVTYKLEK